MKHKETSVQNKFGQIVIIKGEEKTEANGTLVLLSPLELECDNTENKELNPKAPEFRPTRKAAEIAKQSVKETLKYEGREFEDD